MEGLRHFEDRLRGLCDAARLLPAMTPRNAAEERARLIACLRRREPAVPRWELQPRRAPAGSFKLIDELRRRVGDLPAADLYLAKLDELELDLTLVDVMGNARRVRPLAARRFGTGQQLVSTSDGPVLLAEYALALLHNLWPETEPRTVPAEAPGDQLSLAGLVRALAGASGLDVDVRVERSLAAGAATGERTVYVAERRFGAVEAVRLAVHEVLGHLVSAANGRGQPLRLLEWGTAGSFADQEGVALYLEELHGVMDATRKRTLAARVVATDLMHAGARFDETACRLIDDEGFSAEEAVAICERAYRGGGAARDAGYLSGWLRVRYAVETGNARLSELRLGRVGLDSLPRIRTLLERGMARPAAYRPHFSCSFFSTRSGTRPLTSPPSKAASLIRLELT